MLLTVCSVSDSASFSWDYRIPNWKLTKQLQLSFDQWRIQSHRHHSMPSGRRRSSSSLWLPHKGRCRQRFHNVTRVAVLNHKCPLRISWSITARQNDMQSQPSKTTKRRCHNGSPGQQLGTKIQQRLWHTHRNLNRENGTDSSRVHIRESIWIFPLSSCVSRCMPSFRMLYLIK